MKDWALKLILTCFIITLFNILLPNGKTGKSIKTTFSFLLILMMFEPLSSIKGFNFNFDQLINVNNVNYQSDYIDYFNSKLIEKYKSDCKSIIESFEVDNVSCELVYSTNDTKINVENVILNFQNAVFNSDKDHIVIIENIKELISQYFSIDSKYIIIVN